MGPSRDGIEPTVLLVGAGERFTPAFQAALARYRVQVETAELGTVVDAVIVTAPDLVLLMGDTAKDGGSAVLQKLGTLSQNFSVPVVVLNDDAELDQKLSAFRHGATAVLPRSASVDTTAAEVAKLAREIPEQGSDAQGGLGEATLDEFIGALSRQLRSGLVSSLSGSGEGGEMDDVRLVLGRGRPLTEFLDTFVRRVRRHVVRAEPLHYELGAGAESSDGLARSSSAAGKSEIEGLRLVLADDDTPRADAVAQELRGRGVTVVVTDLEPSATRFQTLRQADPTVFVIGEEHAHTAGYELLRRVRRDSRLRWASLLVVRWEEIWAEERGAPLVERLESTLAGLAGPERGLLSRASARVAFDTRLEATGPARCLRTLGRPSPALRVHVDNARVALTVDLSDGLVVGAEGRTLEPEPTAFSGVHALAALLVLGSGRVRVEPVDQPAVANVMTPVEAALNMADAEPPPIAPSIRAQGSVSMPPVSQPDAREVSAAPASLREVTAERGSVRPLPIVSVGPPRAPLSLPRPALPLGPPPPGRLVAPPVVSRPPVSLTATSPGPFSALRLPVPTRDLTPPAVTLPASTVGSAVDEPRGAPPRGGSGSTWTQFAAWFARQEAKLHARRISGRVAAVLVGLGALQGVLLVGVYAGGRWLMRPGVAPARAVAAAEAPRQPVPPPPAPPAAPEPPPQPAPATAPPVDAVRADGSGRDVPDCKSLLGAESPPSGSFPGAELQSMRAGRAAIVRGDLPLAQTSLCRAAQHDPQNAEIALELSLVLLLRRDGAEALDWARRAVELDPKSLGAKDALGDSLARIGDEVAARAAWLEAARIEPDNQAGMRALVRRATKQADQSLRRRDLVMAERAFRRASILEPKSNASSSGLAQVLLELGDVSAAVIWARRAVAIAPRSASACLVLGDALAKSGDKPAAVQQWREATLLDPTHREAQKRLRGAESRRN